MKKIAKSVLALAIAVILAFSSLTAFAANEENIINYEDVPCYFSGAVSEGKNTVTVPDAEAIYFTFNAEKAGYYLVSYYWNDIIGLFSPEKVENGTASGRIESRYINESTYDVFEVDSLLFYFNEGENILISDTNFGIDTLSSTEIIISFCGSDVSEISFAAGTEYFCVLDYNIYELYNETDSEENYVYELDSGKTEITFDSGKKLSMDYFFFTCYSETEITEGEFEIDVEFLNKKFKKTISVYPVTKAITDIEVVNIEKYLDVPVAYNGRLLYDFSGMELIMTYADGHTEKVTIDEYGESPWISLNNGNPYEFYFSLYYLFDDDMEDLYLYVNFGDQDFIEEKCTLRDATNRENRQHLNYRIYEIISGAAEIIAWDFQKITWAENLWEGMVYLRRAVFNLADEFFRVFENIADEFIEYKKA